MDESFDDNDSARGGKRSIKKWTDEEVITSSEHSN